MGRGVISLVGMLLAAVVTMGTWCYIAGLAPAYPANAYGFNGLLLLCVLFALACGRRT